MGPLRGAGAPTGVKGNLPMPLAIGGEIDASVFSESSVYVNCSDLTDVNPGCILAPLVPARYHKRTNRERSI